MGRTTYATLEELEVNTHSVKTFVVCCAVVCSAWLAAGCATPRKSIGSMAELGLNEAVLVGRIEMVPPLQGGEQKLEGFFTGDMRNRAYFLTDDHWREVQGEPSYSDYRGYVGEEFGKTFAIAVPRQPLYILKGIMYVHFTKNRWEQAWLPGGLKVDLQSGDKAVYMGTVRYHRNEFMDITKVEIVDEFDREKAVFAKKFGSGPVLRKKLATAVKTK
jgi:hypothetical protein